MCRISLLSAGRRRHSCCIAVAKWRDHATFGSFIAARAFARACIACLGTCSFLGIREIVAECGSLRLLNEYLIADRAVLAFGKAGLCAGRRYCGVYGLGVTECGNLFQSGNNTATVSAHSAGSTSSRSAGRGNFFAFDRLMCDHCDFCAAFADQTAGALCTGCVADFGASGGNFINGFIFMYMAIVYRCIREDFVVFANFYCFPLLFRAAEVNIFQTFAEVECSRLDIFDSGRYGH